ncbi:MAG TPA: fatty acyl-AMP ligase [Solirubrobacteraceae bacterium]
MIDALAQRIWLADAQRELTLPEILAEHAMRRPDAPAFGFLADGEELGATLTFGELDRQARVIASHLAGFTGRRAVLVYPSNAEFIAALFGCLLAGVVAVHAPLVASTAERTLSRVEVVADGCGASLVLAPAEIADGQSMFVAADSRLRDLPWYASDLLAADESRVGSVFPPPPDRDRLAVIQYTSGTTGTARGIPLRHSQITDQAARMHARLHSEPHSVTVGWTPLFHDLGLFLTVFEPVYSGHRAVVVFPLAFLARPIRWLAAISGFGGTISGAPNFAYELCVRRTTADDRATLDLSSWEATFVGGEQVRPATLDRFAEAFGPCGFDPAAFIPAYGLAEATCGVTGRTRGPGPISRNFDRAGLAAGRAVETPDGHRVASVGFPYLEQRIEIVDPATRRLAAPGAIGEIWVQGSGVADGYWNDPDATAETFGWRLAGDGDRDGDGDGPFLRTGDLGFTSREELFVVGRLKELVIVRGRNIHPADIEATAQASHPSLRPGCGAAFAVDAQDAEALVIAQEMRAGADADPAVVKDAITRAVLDDHEADVRAIVLLPPGSIPKTTSGKIQRRLCRTRFLQGTWPIPARR